MNEQEITTLLHHRHPYLMVSEVLEIDNRQITTIKKFTGNEFYLEGHFPGAPIVPGAMLQEFCTQSAGILITKLYSPVPSYNSETTKGWALGVLNKVEYAKYLEMVKPTADITAKITLKDFHDSLFKFQAKVLQGDILKAKLSFNLVNISDKHLF